MDHVEAWQTAAAVISACCAMVAATVSVAVWRKARSTDLSGRIDGGDLDAKAHTDRSVSALREQTSSTVQEIRQTVDHLSQQVDEVRQVATRMEADAQNMLRPRDLGRVHEKINAVATETTANSAKLGAIGEQVGVIYKLLLKGKTP